MKLLSLLLSAVLAAPAKHLQVQDALDDFELPDVENAIHDAIEIVNDAKKIVQEVVDTVSSSGLVTSWQMMTHPEFPRLAFRYRETQKLCDPNVKQYVGYLDVDDDKHFFLWLFESRSKPKTDPLILWLNGGPGCSSMTGLLMELGPCRVNPGGNDTTVNPHSWNNEATVVFLDQPVNVGFSYSTGEGISDSDSAAVDVYGFLQILLTTFPEYAELDFHVTGESYAGHYIPAIGKAISDGNAEVLSRKMVHAFSEDEEIEDDGRVHINLKSLAIGNGLTDPLNQYAYYADMAEDTKYGPILDEAQVEEMRSKWPTCQNLIGACYTYQSAFTCVPGSIYCNSAMIQPFQSTGLNIYDIRRECDPQVNPLCYDIINDIEAYLNLPHVQETLGVDMAFQGCKTDINVNFLFNGDWMRPYVNYIPPLLAEGVAVLIYAGDADFICNWIGNKAWAMALEWDGQEGFDDAEDKPWVSSITGKPAGEFRMYDNFAFLRVYEAGHMVPYDQPEHSLEFINRWIHGDKKQSVFA